MISENKSVYPICATIRNVQNVKIRTTQWRDSVKKKVKWFGFLCMGLASLLPWHIGVK